LPWVEDEVIKASAEERICKQLVLFLIRLDDTVMKTPEPESCRTTATSAISAKGRAITPAKWLWSECCAI
jgi:hypothetical protein